MRLRSVISTTIALLVIAARGASAQCNSGPSCSVQVLATATINTVARLSISNTTTSLTTPKAADFGSSAGVTSIGPTITVLSNAGYALTAAASATSWTGPSGANKPATDLKMIIGAGPVPLGQVGTSSTGTSGKPYSISYNTIYNWTTDKPGTYSLVVNYTLTAP
jgi:hypothetical protein